MRSVALLALLLVQARLLCAGASVPEPPAVPVAHAAPAAVPVEGTRRADFDRLIGRVESLRGLRFRRPVPSYVQTRDEMRLYLIKTLDEQTKWDEEEATMKAFGFVPETYDVRGGIVAFYTDQVAGYYDYRTASFYMVDADGNAPGVGAGEPPPMDDSMVVHEMDHALQDQHFGLEALDERTRSLGQDDFTLATSSLIEGEATLVMLGSILKDMGIPLSQAPPIQKMGSLSGTVGSEAFQAAPLYFRRMSLFPYFNGAAFVDHVRRKGGWEAVDALYGKLPRSTEQIIHPDAYPTEAPRTIKLEDDGPLPDRWARASENTMGEERMRILFEQYLPEHPDRDRWAAGWGGDAFRVYAREGARCLAWRTEWDTLADAQEFANAIRMVLEERHEIHLPAVGRAAWASWRDACLYRVERRGDAVLVIAAAPRSMATLLQRIVGLVGGGNRGLASNQHSHGSAGR